MSLIESAKLLPKKSNRKEIMDDEIELYIAWLFGELTNNQVAKVAYPSSKNLQSAMLYRASHVLREAASRGLIVRK